MPNYCVGCVHRLPPDRHKKECRECKDWDKYTAPAGTTAASHLWADYPDLDDDEEEGTK